MKFVYKHNKTEKYLNLINWKIVDIEDINCDSIFDYHDMAPPLSNYSYVSYEKEIRKQKLKKLNDTKI